MNRIALSLLLLAGLTCIGCGGNAAVTIENYDKIAALEDSPPPHSIAELEEFLGTGEKVSAEEFRDVVGNAPPSFSGDVEYWVWYGSGSDYIAAIYSPGEKQIYAISGKFAQ